MRQTIQSKLENYKSGRRPRSFGSRRKLSLLPNREAGYYMVEALVCCLIVGIISAGLADGYAKMKAMGVSSQTQLQAIGLAQECIDQLRAQQFFFVLQNLGTHNIPVNGNSATGDPLFPRPLLRDTQALTYFNGSAQGINGADDTQNFLRITNNTIAVTLAAGNNGTVDINIVINWADGQGNHTYTVNSTLTASGLNG